MAIFHNRYATTGGNTLERAQPLSMHGRGVCFNGNITNYNQLMAQLGLEQRIGSDTELLLGMVDSYADEAVVFEPEAMLQQMDALLDGCWNMGYLDSERLIVSRDHHGFRPMHTVEHDGMFLASSESFALKRVIGQENHHKIRELQPGEYAMVQNQKVTYGNFAPATPHGCFFELIYFLYIASRLDGQHAYKIRYETGRQMAREELLRWTDSDNRSTFPEFAVVFGVPRSGEPMAQGFANELTALLGHLVPYITALVRNDNSDRSFLHDQDPCDVLRSKFDVIEPALNGEIAELHGMDPDRTHYFGVDDSLVRGNTTRYLMPLLGMFMRKPQRLHARYGSPPVRYPCFKGIATPTVTELAATMFMDPQQRGHELVAGYEQMLSAYLGLSPFGSARHISFQGLAEVLTAGGKSIDEFCTACLTGDYPTPGSMVRGLEAIETYRHLRGGMCN